jgi:hypothetical protein
MTVGLHKEKGQAEWPALVGELKCVRSRLALAELEAAAGTGLAVLLTLDLA